MSTDEPIRGGVTVRTERTSTHQAVRRFLPTIGTGFGAYQPEDN